MTKQKASRRRRSPYGRAPKAEVKDLVRQADLGSLVVRKGRGRPQDGETTLATTIMARWSVSRRTALRAVAAARRSLAADRLREEKRRTPARFEVSNQLAGAFAATAQQNKYANKYANPEQSGLATNVNTSGSNNLTSQPPSPKSTTKSAAEARAAGVRTLADIGLGGSQPQSQPPSQSAEAKQARLLLQDGIDWYLAAGTPSEELANLLEEVRKRLE